jgi:MoaA/NifB/PqqE/SkfB family radical SAM enzyme
MPSELTVLPKIPRYQSFRALGYPKTLPINVTFSVTYTCNSRCKTCNIWKKKTQDLSIEEIDKTFQSIGKSVYWVTISGGEPFLRKDIVEICQIIYRNCEPGIINIPTNGLLHQTIPEKVKKIVESCPKTNIVINLSLDNIGLKHDEIRGTPGNWEKAIKTYTALRELKYPNFELGVHSVISNYSIKDILSTYEYVQSELKPDSFITEIAEERVELDNFGIGITPPIDQYSEVISALSDKLKQKKFNRIAKVAQSFRFSYYDLVKQTIRRKTQVIPCFAGFASAQVAPDGDVWTCCIRAEPIGNLRETNYDFKKIWFSDKAENLRKSIKNKECYCPLANASYTNMLMHFPTLARVAWRVITP